jgi:hypothetical protein
MTLELYIGKKSTGIHVEPIDRWPGMYRVRKGDEVSDMVNLTRAKDAGITWAHSQGVRRAKKPRWVEVSV